MLRRHVLELGFVAAMALCFPFLSGCMSSDDAIPSQSFQTDLNLGFEETTYNNAPVGWYTGGNDPGSQANYKGSVDGTVVHGGKHSLKLEYVAGLGYGIAEEQLAVKNYRGKTITYSGWIKTKDVNEFAGLWMGVTDSVSYIAFNDMSDSLISGTTDWKQYTFQLPVDSAAVRIYFGATLSGTGTAWFDDLSIQ